MAFRSTKIHAPELAGRGGWINTNSKDLSLQELRGHVVLLDFWTSSCINCIHVMEELRDLEKRYDGDQLAVVGIHSPKFEHEGNHDAVVAAVERYGIDHPVLDDPDLSTWMAYGVRAWPTLVVVDQQGYVAYVGAGERQLPALIKVIDGLLEAKGQKRDSRSRSPERDVRGEVGGIWHPSKLTALADGTLFLANAGGHNILQLTAGGSQIIRTIGSGIRGADDGSLEQARFSEPTAVLSLSPETHPQVPYDMIVADRGNHALRSISLKDAQVKTLATGLPSPWDIVYWPAIDRVVIAIAGRHVIAGMNLRSGEVVIIAGSGREGIQDGPDREAEFAQPSGLAAEPGPDGSLWVIDAETSALRRLWSKNGTIFVETAVGRGLFDFGHKDGPASQALLQHPEGVSLGTDPDSVLIADTFNGAVRKYTKSTGLVGTVVESLSEPTDVLVLDSGLLVVESAANRVTKVDLEGDVEPVNKEPTATVKSEPTDVAADLNIEVVLDLPGSLHIDSDTESPVRTTITSTPPSLLSEGEGTTHELARELHINESIDSGTIHVSAAVAACDDEAGVCTLMTQDWNLHVRSSRDGAKRIKLVLSGPPSSDDFAGTRLLS